MAKNKKGGNPYVNAKKENIEKLKEKLKAEKVKSAEEQWKDTGDYERRGSEGFFD